MSDSETAMAVAAAIAALRDDDEEMTQATVENGESSAPAEPSTTEGEGQAKEEAAEVPPPEPPKPKTKVLSCLICTKPVTPENTQMGGSNPAGEYERMMRVVCKLLCVDSHPMLKKWQFRHSDEPKKLCCDECCEVVFNVGSLQSIIDRTKLAINKKLEWILKTVSESEAEESEEIEKVFFAPRSDAFRSEVLEVCKRKKNASNGFAMGDSDDEEEELVNKGVQTDISGESGVADKFDKLSSTKAGLKFFDDRPSLSFDDHMDTYSDHNDDMSYGNSYDNDDSNFSYSSKSETKRTPASSSRKSGSSKQPTRRGRPSNSNKRPLKFDDDDDDDIEVLEEKKAPNKPRGRAPPAKSPKIDARELLKVEYSESGGRPKRSAAAKRPNYQALAGDDDEFIPSVKRQSPSSVVARKSAPRKEVTLSAIPIVKDASGKTYFEGVEIVRTEKSITCKHLGCFYVVDGAGYNAFERIKAHIHETHIGEGALADIY